MNLYSHLSLRDLVEARDLFHAHLINKRNVVATAVGRYLIRKSDLDAEGRYKGSSGGERTLSNSLVVDISWPCILVFVKEWEEPEALVGRGVNDLVPKTIYMPDGRMVPVCTVRAPRQQITDDSIEVDRLRFPENLIGGGYPLLMHSQGIDRIASVGCVVTDGHKYYALSNKHVTGDGGEEVHSRFGRDWRRIGFASGIALGGLLFSKVYPGWAGQQTLVKCDVGLIEIEDVTRWKTDIFTLGTFGELYDLNTINFDLGIVAEHKKIGGGKFIANSGKVVAYGAVSGRLEGEIAGLFYRYKSVGGTEFVSDFLISGRGGEDLRTHHGDSGTLWLFEEPPPEPSPPDAKPTLRPIALHWGQHDFFANPGDAKRTQFSYGLATCLSNVCRELDVDLVRGWKVDAPYTWGKVGHYTVAAIAIEAVKDKNLRDFLTNNLSNITFANDQINAGLDTKDNPELPKDPDTGLCPLADVPDIIWKQSKKTTVWGRMGDENPNHYADGDAPSTDGKTLFEICDSKDKLTVEVWDAYYDGIDAAALGMDRPVSKGLICFRAWQIYDYMVDAMSAPKAERAARFIFGAGVLAHYVGDSCQPLHSSYMSNGDPADNRTIQYTAKRTSSHHMKGDVYAKVVNPGAGVHSAYEDGMINDKIAEIFAGIPTSKVNAEPIDPIDSGQDAGFAVLTLMRKTQETIQPKTIVEAFKAANGQATMSEALFDELGPLTIDCLARGSNYLAAIWTAAWVKGGGTGQITGHAKVKQKELIDLYRDPDELPSKHLDTIKPLLK